MDKKPQEIVVENAPSLLKLIWKLITYSRDGWSVEEKKELGQDLLVLASAILEDVIHFEDKCDGCDEGCKDCE
tara:strand:+ start:797 stop:1015 length:219 start_codon:yes stop_codon:yes gene_type:complete